MHIQLGEVHRCSIGVQRRKIRRSGAAETETGRRGGSMRERGWDRGGLILNPGDWRGLDETRGDEKPRNTRWYWRAEWRQIKTHSSDATIRHPIQLRCRCFGSRAFNSSFHRLSTCTSTVPLPIYPLHFLCLQRQSDGCRCVYAIRRNTMTQDNSEVNLKLWQHKLRVTK